jgi:hypothetical protein
LAGSEAAVAQVYSQAWSARFAEVVGRLPTLAQAARYAHNEHERATDLLTIQSRQERIARGWELRARAFKALALMEALGMVEAQDADAIRSGTGTRDMAGDLQVIGRLGEQHSVVLDGVQGLKREQDRFSLNDFREMAQLGAALQQNDPSDAIRAEEVRWRGVLISCVVRLEEDWELVRTMLDAAWRLLGPAERVGSLRSLGSLGHTG